MNYYLLYGLLTQSHIVLPPHSSPTVYFVVSYHDGESDGNVNSTELKPAGRQSHEPVKRKINIKNMT